MQHEANHDEATLMRDAKKAIDQVWARRCSECEAWWPCAGVTPSGYTVGEKHDTEAP